MNDITQTFTDSLIHHFPALVHMAEMQGNPFT